MVLLIVKSPKLKKKKKKKNITNSMNTLDVYHFVQTYV
jgi:hypothetical protein